MDLMRCCLGIILEYLNLTPFRLTSLCAGFLFSFFEANKKSNNPIEGIIAYFTVFCRLLIHKASTTDVKYARKANMT